MMVQLECHIGGQWLPARRVDMAHGELHYHTRPWDPGRDRRVPLTTGPLADTLDREIEVTKVDWHRFRVALEAGLQETD